MTRSLSKSFHYLGLMLALVAALALGTGCANPKTINGTTYDSYGLLNENSKKNPDIEYEVVWGNVVWGVILFEMVIPPIYFFGFSLFEPVQAKPATKGALPPS